MSDEVDYILSILGKEGYTAMDHWMPTDPADKNDAGKFLDYLESTLDDEISLHVRVCELEDVRKRTDDTIDALIDHIYQLAHHALIGDGSDTAVEFEVQCSLIHTIPDGDIQLQRDLLKISWDMGISHLLEICHTYYAIESGAAAVCAGKTINAAQKSHWNSKATAEASLTVPELHNASTHLDMTISLPKSLSAKVVWRKDIGKPSVIPARKSNLLLQWTSNQKVHLVSMERRGRRLTS